MSFLHSLFFFIEILLGSSSAKGCSILIVIYVLFQLYKYGFATFSNLLRKSNQILWFFLYLSFLVLFFLPDFPSLFYLGCFFLFVTLLFLRYGVKSESEDLSFFSHFILALEKIYYSPRYLNIKSFWQINYVNRNQEKKKTFDEFLLFLLSFITAINSRFLIIQGILIVRSILFGYFYFLFSYIFLVLFCTLLASWPKFNNYVTEVYGEEAIKKLGWNGLLDNSKVFIKQIAGAASALLGVTLVGTLGEEEVTVACRAVQRTNAIKEFYESEKIWWEAYDSSKPIDEQILPDPRIALRAKLAQIDNWRFSQSVTNTADNAIKWRKRWEDFDKPSKEFPNNPVLDYVKKINEDPKTKK